MIQGTASHVGKSVIAAALCRSFYRRGLRVAPFKAQNMSLNSAVTLDGGEIGRSQAFQAEACGVEPEVAMNPILLKPMSGGRCQVILRGRPYAVVDGHAGAADRAVALEVIQQCLADLSSRFDVLVLEGMGSPAEINLRERDVANMQTAALAGAPVLLVGDIERGGVFAALAGTMELLGSQDRARVAGFLINKYHGDPSVLASGIAELERRYRCRTLAVLPFLPGLRVPEEDAVALDSRRRAGTQPVDVVVPRLPGISNFTDLDSLATEPGVSVRYVTSPDEWDAPTLVVLPGSRSTVDDLAWLRRTGLAALVMGHAARGGWLIGLCGGFQMLGRAIHDPGHVESAVEATLGLGLLDVVTSFGPSKHVGRVRGTLCVPALAGLPVDGYEIHHGTTLLGPATLPAITVGERQGAKVRQSDGAVDSGGRIFGTYFHGFFDSRSLRRRLVETLGGTPATTDQPPVLDLLADWLEARVPMDELLQLAGIAP